MGKYFRLTVLVVAALCFIWGVLAELAGEDGSGLIILGWMMLIYAELSDIADALRGE